MRAYTVFFLLLVTYALSANAQSRDTGDGSRVYEAAADSVLLLYAQADDGTFVAQGSGFLVSGQLIVTNAHVANAGKIFLVLGPAKIPTLQVAIDNFNDIALLRTEAELAIKELTLTTTKITPGEKVFVIGNPKGLEKSISEGLISGIRVVDSRDLLQLSAAISHGSSGGPVLSVKGEVVGVIVGTLQDGQNLNFAVPVSTLRQFLTLRSVPNNENASVTLDRIRGIEEIQKNEQYSSDNHSPWQLQQQEINKLLTQAMDESGSDSGGLLRVAQVASEENIDLSVEAAQRSINIKSSSEAQFILAKGLLSNSIFTSDEGSKKEILNRAERAARISISTSKKPNSEMYYTLAEILSGESSFAEAQKSYKLALSVEKAVADENLFPSIYRGLIFCANSLSNPTEAELWFRKLVSTNKAYSTDWGAEAERLYKQSKFGEAAMAYTKAGELDGIFNNWCLAAVMYSSAGEDDLTLDAARKCIDKGTGQKNSEGMMGDAHREIADVLNKRGVYSEGLAHARESISLQPNEPWAYDSMAAALIGLRRFQESISPAQQAIRLTDGKYSYMHFRLGSAYFELENWEFARQSFQKASELDVADGASTYNVGLCLVRLHFYVDAIKWYQEYLRRRPTASDRAEVEQLIQKLRNQ